MDWLVEKGTVRNSYFFYDIRIISTVAKRTVQYKKIVSISAIVCILAILVCCAKSIWVQNLLIPICVVLYSSPRSEY